MPKNWPSGTFERQMLTIFNKIKYISKKYSTQLPIEMDHKNQYRMNREKIVREKRELVSIGLAEYFSSLRNCIHNGIEQRKTSIFCGMPNNSFLYDHCFVLPNIWGNDKHINIPSTSRDFVNRELKKFNLDSNDINVDVNKKNLDDFATGWDCSLGYSRHTLYDVEELIRETNSSWES